jgi:hypothetical protein
VKKSADKSNHKGHQRPQRKQCFFVLFVSCVFSAASKYPISSQALGQQTENLKSENLARPVLRGYRPSLRGHHKGHKGKITAAQLP